MKRYFHLVLVIIITGSLLSACMDTFPSPAARPLTNDQSSVQDYQIDIAVDSNGGKHIVRAECPPGTNPSCWIVYEHTHQGETGVRQLLMPDEGYTYRYPDVAVTDSGLGYLTWLKCETDNSGVQGCSTLFTRSDDFQVRELNLGSPTASAPGVLSRGEEVYVLNSVTNNQFYNSALRYCHFSYPTASCHWVSDHPNDISDTTIRSFATGVISTSGDLYVAWLERIQETPFASTYASYLNDNSGAHDGDMVHRTFLSSGYLSNPGITIEPDDGNIYVGLTTNDVWSGDSQMDIYYCVPAECRNGTSVMPVDLQTANIKYVADLSLTADNSMASYGFAASSDSLGIQSDIYIGYCLPDSSSCSINQVNLANGINACNPKMVLVSGYGAIGWHNCADQTDQGDVYFYDLRNHTRLIHDAAYSVSGDLEIDANGDFVAGIWNEEQADGRVATWLAFNARLSYIPVILK